MPTTEDHFKFPAHQYRTLESLRFSINVNTASVDLTHGMQDQSSTSEQR
jgi:hypothetical protein